MKAHHLLQMAYRECLTDQDRALIDPVRMKLQAEIKGCGVAGSVELVYRLGQLFAEFDRRKGK